MVTNILDFAKQKQTAAAKGFKFHYWHDEPDEMFYPVKMTDESFVFVEDGLTLGKNHVKIYKGRTYQLFSASTFDPTTTLASKEQAAVMVPLVFADVETRTFLIRLNDLNWRSAESEDEFDPEMLAMLYAEIPIVQRTIIEATTQLIKISSMKMLTSVDVIEAVETAVESTGLCLYLCNIHAMVLHVEIITSFIFEVLTCNFEFSKEGRISSFWGSFRNRIYINRIISKEKQRSHMANMSILSAVNYAWTGMNLSTEPTKVYELMSLAGYSQIEIDKVKAM